jgi:hypothetical protein
MPIPISCPACGESYLLADEMAGKRVRCRKCQDAFDVPPFAVPEGAIQESPGLPPAVATDDLPPAGERYRGPDRDREDDPDGRRPRRRPAPPPPSNAWVWWVLGGLGALLFAVVLLCGGVIWFVSSLAGTAVDRAVQNLPPPPPALPPPVEVPNFLAGGIMALDEALTALRSPDADRRRDGVIWLIHNRHRADPQRKQEVLDALEPLRRDPDVHVRGFARHAQIVWRAFR